MRAIAARQATLVCDQESCRASYVWMHISDSENGAKGASDCFGYARDCLKRCDDHDRFSARHVQNVTDRKRLEGDLTFTKGSGTHVTENFWKSALAYYLRKDSAIAENLLCLLGADGSPIEKVTVSPGGQLNADLLVETRTHFIVIELKVGSTPCWRPYQRLLYANQILKIQARTPEVIRGRKVVVVLVAPSEALERFEFPNHEPKAISHSGSKLLRCVEYYVFDQQSRVGDGIMDCTVRLSGVERNPRKQPWSIEDQRKFEKKVLESGERQGAELRAIKVSWEDLRNAFPHQSSLPLHSFWPDSPLDDLKQA